MNEPLRRPTTGPGTWYPLEVRSMVPERIGRLVELADDLYYAWSSDVRQLYAFLDRELWNQCGHNPKLFLRHLAQERLDDAARDPVFLQRYSSAISAYDTYHQEEGPPPEAEALTPGRDLVAYFCAEFGLHESLPIYSGGLGILAGDHCKAASDLRLPFVAIGLLYRRGYFTQTIDAYGNQIAASGESEFSQLPISPALDAEGRPVEVRMDLDGRPLVVKVWQVKSGRVFLYLLDTDVPANDADQRAITQQLYIADPHVRLRQELVLGVGGVRALRALGLRPSAWHINEGHPAFAILERCREEVAAGATFETALELVASNTVFTTHTPVPAGHDVFDHHLIRRDLATMAEALGIGVEALLELGAGPGAQGGFNMTALAVRGARFVNGVSRVHGEVAARMLGFLWPQVPHDENPVTHVTNGVHVFTFLAREWRLLFDVTFGNEWRRELTNAAYWERIGSIADGQYWSTHQAAKAELLRDLRRRAQVQFRRNGCSEVEVARVTRQLAPENTDVLIVGFARRFATYKRATLLFGDPRRLARLLGDPARPVLLVFAGKAHPSDLAGQQLIQAIHQLSRQPEFEGKLLLLEGYDLALGRRLVAGVDVWLNTPEYPMEASGTSGQKAGMNGVVNLSVLDGWWAEGCDGANGWGVPGHGGHIDPAERDRIESQALLDVLEHEVLPLYFDRNGRGYSEGWVRRSKASMQSILPRFNAQRMVKEYARDFYAPAQRHRRQLEAHGGRPAARLAEWRQRVTGAWSHVRARRSSSHPNEVRTDQRIPVEVAAHLGGLDIRDVRAECLVGRAGEGGAFVVHETFVLEPQGLNEQGEALFRREITPPLSGLQFYKLRLYPYHAMLRHPLECGLIVWV